MNPGAKELRPISGALDSCSPSGKPTHWALSTLACQRRSADASNWMKSMCWAAAKVRPRETCGLAVSS